MLLTCSAWAQEPSPAKPTHLSADVYAGYSYLAPNFGADFLGGHGENGFTAGADLHVTRLLAVAAEMDWMHVIYGSQLSSSAFTAMAGPRLFFPPVFRARVTLLADILGGAANFNNLVGANSPFTGTVAPAIAADGGVEVRVVGPLAVRVEGGYLHSGFTARYPDVDTQSSIHNQHGRLLIEGVWHF
jgi:hypothetical protein